LDGCETEEDPLEEGVGEEVDAPLVGVSPQWSWIIKLKAERL
jgi:hypothetical protein